jgi:hypothetical protein
MAPVRLHRERERLLPPAFPDDLGLLRRLVALVDEIKALAEPASAG